MQRTLAAGVLAVAACAGHGGQASVLPASDLVTAGGAFDADEIVAAAPMQDATTLAEASVQSFLQHTPYGTPSFLAVYASHGLSAASAIASAAQSYGLDPLVFLVRAEADQGLVALTQYPSEASRVEYAFGCGCEAPGDCAASMAGFDLQVECLGAALRASLDAVASTGKTAGGWGPGVAATTLDGVRVTPADASTAALYQYDPVVATGQPGGNWLVWNLWHRYAAALGYSGPPAPPSWIGASCTESSTCAYGQTPGVCATQFPGGLCTLACTGGCPLATGQAQTFCADFGAQGGYCLAECDPKAADCRAGYSCESVKEVGDTAASAYVCFP